MNVYIEVPVDANKVSPALSIEWAEEEMKSSLYALSTCMRPQQCTNTSLYML
jgi:hypothetical protein